MSSKTLKAILEVWNPADTIRSIYLPFDIEQYCRQNDALIERLEKERDLYRAAFNQQLALTNQDPTDEEFRIAARALARGDEIRKEGE